MNSVYQVASWNGKDYNHFVRQESHGLFRTIVTEGNKHEVNPKLVQQKRFFAFQFQVIFMLFVSSFYDRMPSARVWPLNSLRREKIIVGAGGMNSYQPFSKLCNCAFLSFRSLCRVPLLQARSESGQRLSHPDKEARHMPQLGRAKAISAMDLVSPFDLLREGSNVYV